MKRNKTYSLAILFTVAIAFIVGSCKKLVDVTPPSTTVNSATVYANDATAIAAVTNIYVNMSKANLTGGGISSLNLFPSLSADELSLYSAVNNTPGIYYYRNALANNNLNSPDFWSSFYQSIYSANQAIEALNNTSTLTPVVKQQLTGEAKFIRAFAYFYLVNLYGDVPLALGTDYKINSALKRTPKADVYTQIIKDLKDAQSLLSTNYLNGTLLATTEERVRPTRWAATALLARVDLYTGDYANAANEATTVINSSLFSLAAMNDVFKKNSSEAIWQLQPVNTGWNTEDAKAFVLPVNGPDAYAHPFLISPQLLGSFETNDKRKTNWVNSVTVGGTIYYYPYKYKSASYGDAVTEYEMVLRLGEQYLIRAEAEAQLNQISDAKNDLNLIRTRAGLSGTSANDKNSLLSAILHERQVELFTEWGHRWFDLKRTGNIDAVMNNVTPIKGGTWNSNWQWYPISRNELLLNTNLIQNSGY